MAKPRRASVDSKAAQKPAGAIANWRGSQALGAQLRQAREMRGIKLREFARQVGVSASLVSQIENGHVTPSVGTLFAFCTQLGLLVDDLFKGVERANGDIAPEGDAHSPTHRSRGPIQRSANRKRIRLAGGVRWERLTPDPDEQVEFIHVVYEVGAASCPEDSLVRHGGKEYACILSGQLGLQLRFETYELGPGDSLTFDSQNPHRFWCIGDEPAVAIWVIFNRSADDRNRGWSRVAKTSLSPAGRG
ncbi:MAG: XRE family transcriptional regulator [Bauldia sp.]